MQVGTLFSRWRGAAAALMGAAVVLASPVYIRGQQQAITPEVPMSMARAQAFVDAASQGLDYLPGEVLVKFKAGVTVDGQQRALDAMRSRPTTDRLEWIGDVAVLRDPSQPDANAMAASLRTQPEVQYAEPNYIRRHRATTPNDPGYGLRQWNLKLIDMPDAWDISPGGSASVIVAVVDTGVTVANNTTTVQTWNGTSIQNLTVKFGVNPDITASRFVSPADFVTTYSFGVVDTDGHGTHVTSTIGEDTNNSIADAGIAYKSMLMPVKVCASFWDVQFAFSAGGGRGFVPPDSGGCPDSAIVQGIRYAVDNGAKVLNLSFGGEGQTQAELDALNYAVGKGAFIATSAGNEKESGNPVEYPAADGPNLAGMMAVGAVNKDSQRAYYSNTGNYIEIAAPGGDDRDSDASGSGFIFQSTLRPATSDPSETNTPTFDLYSEVGYEGTSMASPHVAGLAALLMAQGVRNPATIEQLIKKTAKFLGTASATDKTRSDEFGSGLIQPRAALFGFGVKK
jgi:serine protease